MKRTKSFILSFLISGAAGASTLASAQPVSNKETEAPEIQAVIDKNLPKVSSKDQKEREQALWGLFDGLLTLWNTKHVSANKTTRKLLSQELILLYKNTTAQDFSTPDRRRQILATITINGDNEVAKPFLLNLLNVGSDQERTEVLMWIGGGPAVKGDDVYEKIKDLGKHDVVTKGSELAYLARIDKDKALPEILQELKTSTDKKVVFSAARTLQNIYRKPEYYRQILPRIKAVGLDKESPDGQGGDGLFFIDHDLLTEYVGTTQADESKLALEIFNKSGGSSSEKIIPMLNRKIKDNDPEVRVMAAKALRHAMDSIPSQASQIRETLKTSAEQEKDPDTKKVFKGMLDEIQWGQEMRRRYEDRLNQGKPK